MYSITTTTSDVQTQSFTLYDVNYRLTLRYNAVLKSYQFDLYSFTDGTYIVQNKGLSVGAPAMIEYDLPFVFYLYDNSSMGYNAISKIDFNNRITLYAIDKEEWHEAIWASNSA